MPHSLLSYAALKAQTALIRTGASFAVPKAHSPDDRIQIESRSPGRKININVYRPSSSSSSSSKNARKPSPVLINFHGSGFVIPMHGSDEVFCQRIAKETDFVVLDAAYALAPEHPFPAAIEDAEDVILWVLGRPAEYDSSKVSLSGFSAGANVAIAVAADPTNKVPANAFRSLIAFYPPCDLSGDSGTPYSKRAPDGSQGIPGFVASLFDNSYMPPEVDRADPRISILKADFGKLPPKVLVVTAGKDNLALEAEEMARKMQAAGKRVTQKRSDGVGHAFDKAPKPGSIEEEKTEGVYKLAVTFLLTSDEP